MKFSLTTTKALNCILKRIRFARGYGPVINQTTERVTLKRCWKGFPSACRHVSHLTCNVHCTPKVCYSLCYTSTWKVNSNSCQVMSLNQQVKRQSAQWPGWWLRNGGLIPSHVKRFSILYNVQTSPMAHPSSYSMGSRGSIIRGKVAKAWRWPLTST
jgi:hypothetical protein